MSRPALTALLAVLVLAAVGLVAGCGGGDDKKAATDPSNTEAANDAEKAARVEANRRIREEAKKHKAANGKNAKPHTAAERAKTAQRAKANAAAQRKKDAADDKKFDREFDKGFQESAFDKLVVKLPIRKPPLYVQQYITNQGSHRIYTAVDRRRFLCNSTPSQRRKAVAGYFRAADKLMRAGGVKDFVQVVTVTSQSTQDLPALAEARKGSVALKGTGREPNPC